MKWKIASGISDDVLRLCKKYKIGELQASILASRGNTEPDKVKFYLEKNISFMNNPFRFHDMEMFCDRINSAVESGEKVRVFGDRDVDGITSTVLMVQELKSLGLDVTYTIPTGDETYGFSKEKIDSAVNDGVTLAVSVDCGVSAFSEVDYASSKGIDFLITDHHLNEGNLPPAEAVIDPKLEYSGYPFESLAGCGVALQCIWALRFSRTDFYNERFLLLHSYTENNVCVIECAEICNMMVEERISEEVVPGVLSESKSRLIKFLDRNLPVLVIDADYEKRQLRSVFPKAEINLTDIREKLEQVLPVVRDRTLFDLKAISRFGQYEQAPTELDTLIGLFFAYIRLSVPSLYAEFKKLTPLAAIGTISDMMPLVGENRIIVNTGLEEMVNPQNVGLRVFLRLSNLLGLKLSAKDVAWEVSPVMNSAGRMGYPETCVQLLLSDDESSALEYAQKLVQLNKQRKKLSDDIWERMLPSAKKSFESTGSKFVMVSNNYLPRGLTGILASRCVKFFKVPSVLVAVVDDGSMAIGSVRSPDNFNCYDFLSDEIFSDLFINFGGHAFAGGFSLNPENIPVLFERIGAYSDSADLTPAEPELLIDAYISPQMMDWKLFDIIPLFEPYGEKNPALCFLIRDVRIEKITVLNVKNGGGKNSARLILQYGNSTWSSVFWNCGYRIGKDFDEGEIVDVVFNPTVKSYNDSAQYELNILDIKRAGKNV